MCKDPYLETPGLACGRKADRTTAFPLIVLLSLCSSGEKKRPNLSCAFALSQCEYQAGLAPGLVDTGQAFLRLRRDEQCCWLTPVLSS